MAEHEQHHHFTWPRVPDVRHRVACHFCDTLHEVDLIEEGISAHCRVCEAVLYRNRPNSVRRAVAFGVTSLCLFVLVMLFPFIEMDSQGNKSIMTVPGAVLALWSYGGPAIAVSVAIFVLILPGTLILTFLYLGIPLLFGAALRGSTMVMKTLQGLQNWVMVEVFFLGAIVSLLKLVKLADIHLGVGFWASGLLMFCLAGAVGGIDRIELWDRIELALRRKDERQEEQRTRRKQKE